ncbi:MAG: hypothetical protein M1119_07935 [Firmicutes bacterium]|nr:hypothetical protein [Bacillota bacterium]
MAAMDTCRTRAQKLKVSCPKCGKTLMFYQPAANVNANCVVVEIKCRNRECKAISKIKLCNRICD